MTAETTDNTAEDTAEDTRTDEQRALDYLSAFAQQAFFAIAMAEQYVDRSQVLVKQLMGNFKDSEELEILYNVGEKVMAELTAITSKAKDTPEEVEGEESNVD